MTTVDRAQLAEMFRVTQKTVHAWIQDGMPVVSAGSPGGGKDRDKTQIDLQAALTWWLHRNRGRLEWIRQQSRLAAERAQRLRLENDERRKDLCSADVWNAAVSEEIARTHRILLELAKREAPAIARMTDVAQIHAHLTRVMHDALRQLAGKQRKPNGRHT